ncbi:MAG: biosynthetic-type acetolactate synthase large subunit [Christensenella sp.]|uniref:biosynthetic-type acetolactate synthase large subunit n=1 Tax=Christensenella sp. TaxID=1935934 RepID=UPI002B218160|nr:biosynthetic-type acetolactate synthase large subunit [Christensenella sp.]MEA5003265.1 biosynthetic-type acetolactate synthase large subunit [Christensenella sp.]
MKLTGAQIIMECLKEQQVDTVFGFPGGTVIPIYDALYHYPEINHILTCHEQHAAHAADGYARATGKPGVVIATSGPGATNLVTGIATAYMDSVPMVAITGNVEQKNLGKDSFQEIDITGVTIPITKHNVIVQSIEDLAKTIREAFFIAQSGRPGPVLVDITKDVTIESCEYTPQKPKAITRVSHFNTADIAAAAAAINDSKKPFIMAGGGVIASDAEQGLRKLAKKLNAPVTMTLMGLGAYPAGDEQYTGMTGMHGTKASALCTTHCDLLITIGARFSERVTSDRMKFAKQAKILHIDIDPAEINKNITADYEVIGDAKAVLEALLPKVKQKTDKEWLTQAMEWKKKYPLDRATKNARFPKKVIQAMQEAAPDDAIFTTEVGQHQLWSAQFLKIEQPRQFITSGGLGTMGFGMGAAMGAAIATGRQVVNIAGDGSFHMNLQEIVTAVKHQLPIMILVMNNNVLGMVRQWQKIMFDGRYSQTTLNRPTDYVKLAEAFGACGVNISGEKDLAGAFKKAFECKGPVIVQYDISEDENVLPMVPGGKTFDSIILDWEK